MTLDIPQYRLYNQRLYETTFKNPSEVVSWLGAVQAQDYAGAKWALALRATDLTDPVIEQAYADGVILRTHILRPTWHFVAAADLRWVLKLAAPRVHAVNAYMYRKLELNKAIIKKSYVVLEKTLQRNKQLTRSELGSAFEKAGIVAEGQRLGYFMMSAELDGIICSGARRGKQFTYSLLEERVPPVKALKRDEALSELTKRYFATRGPAKLQDFVWWSGLTMADAKGGIEMTRSMFVPEVMEGQTYWLESSIMPPKMTSPSAHLLPNYDEYFIGFRDRSAIGKRVSPLHLEENSAALNAHIIIMDGQIIGGWKRTLKKGSVVVELNLLTQLTKAENKVVADAAQQYGNFLGLPVEQALSTWTGTRSLKWKA